VVDLLRVLVMTASWLNELGDRNPQLLRELRGRFQPRSVLATIGILGVLQILLVLFFLAQLPDEGRSYSAYCIYGAKRIGCALNWKRWWGDLFKALTYIIPYVLYIPGAYALVNDISQETQKGTLNFLRLSPRSSQSILLGKLLGVPILGYFSLLLLLPLHLISGLMGELPVGFFVSFYLGLLAWGALLFTGSMFAGFSGGTQRKVVGIGGVSGLAIVVLIAIAWIPLINFINSITTWYNFGIDGLSFKPFESTPFVPIKWVGWTINADRITPHIFLFANLAFLTYWLWRVLQRAFGKPTATTISKRQGYTIVIYAMCLSLGLVIGNAGAGAGGGAAAFFQIALAASAAIYGSIPLIFLLSTPRQMLLDWSRGRQEVAIAQRAENLSPGKRRSEQIHDRLFGDKSPGVLAILICGLIVYLLISLLLPVTGKNFGKAVLGLALSFTLVANYAVLVQLMLLLETSKRHVWAVGSLICAIVLPALCTAIPGLNLIAGYFTPGLWFLLNDSSSYRGVDVLVFVGVVAWGLMMVLLVGQGLILRTRLRRLGRSV
jgi:hypothetical protein